MDEPRVAQHTRRCVDYSVVLAPRQGAVNGLQVALTLPENVHIKTGRWCNRKSASGGLAGGRVAPHEPDGSTWGVVGTGETIEGVVGVVADS